MPNDTRSFIHTWSGKKFDFLNPAPDAITLEDIAHALAQIPRFGGHLTRFYSVADHCLNVGHMVAWRGANLPTIRAALLHDASVAYLGDIVPPFKPALPQASALKKRILSLLLQKFRIDAREIDFPAIQQADDKMRIMEAKALFRYVPEEYLSHPEVLGAPPHLSRNSHEAELYFLSACRLMLGNLLRAADVPHWQNAERELPTVGQPCEVLAANAPGKPAATRKAILRRCDGGHREYVWVDGENPDRILHDVRMWRPLSERSLKTALRPHREAN